MIDKLVLTIKRKNAIIDQALKEHYCRDMEHKRVPGDYLLMFTEGGEANAIADAISLATVKKVVEVLDKKMVATPVYPHLYLFNKVYWQEITKALEEANNE